jgi:toxin ParE1/3/4
VDDAENSTRARAWFNEMDAAITSLDEKPQRCPVTPENNSLRHLLFRKKPHVYRIIYTINERAGVVRVLHIRHGARAPF